LPHHSIHRVLVFAQFCLEYPTKFSQIPDARAKPQTDAIVDGVEVTDLAIALKYRHDAVDLSKFSLMNFVVSSFKEERLLAAMRWRVSTSAPIEETPMKRFLILATAAFISTAAFAQTAVIQVAPEDRTKIREYVVQKKMAPVRLNEKVVLGAAIPQDVELVAAPGDWGPAYKDYRFFYSDDRVILVDPGTRKVIQIID
jgi:hypothetical protein